MMYCLVGRYKMDENDCKAWCPDCGDLMYIIEDNIGENAQWTYFCKGCNKKFKFQSILEDEAR